MKKVLPLLALMLALSFSTTAFADGETHSSGYQDQSSATQNNTSTDLLTQILNAVSTVVP